MGIRMEAEERAETKGEKVHRLNQQNSEMKLEMISIESERKSLIESNKRLEAEKVNLEKRIAAFMEDYKRFEKEAKDIKFSKNTHGAVLDKKATQLELEAKAIEDENFKMQAEIDQITKKKKEVKTQNQILFDKFGVDDFDSAVAVKPKPKLFGDKM